MDETSVKDILTQDSRLKIFTLFNEVQPENALYPIDVTLSGMVIDVRDEQQQNVLLPIDVTLSGITKLVNNSSFK